jgi:hypothetical protein
MAELRDRTHTGTGWLRGSVEIDQVYAQYQHSGSTCTTRAAAGPCT